MCSDDQARQGHDKRHCCRHRTQVPSFIQPRLLLFLAQKPAHGYELMDRLEREQDSAEADPGFLYRTLRQFEQNGLVCSSWDTQGSGAARRVYQITGEGVDYLHAWAVSIRRTRERVERFLNDYESQFDSKEGR
jgi:poly-beta-hydroxybutyrate-responsive repressor